MKTHEIYERLAKEIVDEMPKLSLITLEEHTQVIAEWHHVNYAELLAAVNKQLSEGR